MSATVRIPTQLRALTGGAEVQVEEGTLAEVFAQITERFPGLAPRILDEEGSLRRFINVYVNDEDVRFLKGLDTEVAPGCRVSIIPSVAGGAVSEADLYALKERLEAALEPFTLLEHPFYRAWSSGELSLEDLRVYACQYWRQVEAFPRYLQELADRLPIASEARQAVLANLVDEVEGDHLGLWLAFAEALGLTEAEVRSSLLHENTKACVALYAGSVASSSSLFALGALYSYESQAVAVSATKRDGLERFYGLNGSGAEYFQVHSEVDVKHSEDLLASIGEQSGFDPDRVVIARAGARAGARAVWELLSGVDKARAEVPSA